VRLAFDMSSVLWSGLLAGKDTEGKEVLWADEKKFWVNSAAYGYENVINKMVSDLGRFRCAPKDCILVFEGLNSKRRRLMIDSAYKEGRDRPAESYAEFQKLREIISKQWRALGAISLTQDNAEGDDVLAWLAKHTEEDLVVISNDGDLTCLHGVNGYGATVHVAIGNLFDENKYGPFPCHLVPVYKSLVGDSSDNIKGCPGFGEKAFLKLYTAYDDYGLEQILAMLEKGDLSDLAEEAETDKLVQKILENSASVIKSYRVAKPRPEWVNTMTDPLKWVAGITLPAEDPKDERLEQWYAKKWLITNDKLAKAMEWARPLIEATPYPALDIETSTPEESDAWLIEQSKTGKADGVDVIASRLTGLSITFGDNLQYSMYFPIDHKDTINCDSFVIRDFISSFSVTWVIQNAAGFELPVLAREWFEDRPISEKFLPTVDTRIMAGYVNENLPEFGLKFLSKHFLGYKQTNYDEVTRVEDGVDEEGNPVYRQAKMNELTGKHVLSYGCDDTITCAALFNFFQLHMQLEHHFKVYKEVETDAYMLGAQAFNDGVNVSRKRIRELADEDMGMHDEAWAVFRQFLVKQGWPGSVPPTYTSDITAAEIKEAFTIVTGNKLESMARTPSKLAAQAKAQGAELFAKLLEDCVAGASERFTSYVQEHFKCEPEWKMSPKQKTTVLYEKMGLPVRLRNALTENMALDGRTAGNPKTDALALAYALKYDVEDRPEIKPVLTALKEMQVVETRQGLFYSPYPKFIHWQTNKVHPQIRQSSTNTRRDSGAKPNVQQVSKHEKVDGEGAPKVREVYVPHHRQAVIVSMDFSSQELCEIAENSRDPNMVACYSGDSRKDMHSMTGLQIARSKGGRFANWTLQDFTAALAVGDPDAKAFRSLGKKVNFTTEYGAMAPKLAQTLLVEEEEAQIFIDAKESTFPDVRLWKDSVEEEAQQKGFVRSRMGAVRHLAELLTSPDRYESSKALRQAVNFKIQSSCAEQTKLARGAAWRAKLLERFDCKFYFPVHDEVVWSCAVKDLFEFIPALHACMVQPFGKDRLIPVESTISFGKSFGPKDQIEIGGVPSREAIQKGLDKYYEAVKEVA
jgi:DNA polymerase I-like protein with 3'-5' exonuclease and polymerase domains/5'-3' exonuclease